MVKIVFLQNKLNLYLSLALSYNCKQLCAGFYRRFARHCLFNKVEPVFRSHKGQKFSIFSSSVEGCCEKSAFNNLVIESAGIHSLSENV